MPRGAEAPGDARSTTVARRLAHALIPLAVAGNLGSYALATTLLTAHGGPRTVPLDAWHIVATATLVTLQASWLAWRQRHPLSTVAICLVLWNLAMVAGGDAAALQPGILLALFLFSSGAGARSRAAVGLVGTATTTTALQFVHAFYAPPGALAWEHPATIAVSLMIAVLLVAPPIAAGAWYARLRAHAEHIADLAHRAVAGEAGRTGAAVAAERRTLAQELHDTSSAHLAAILALAHAIEASDAGTAPPTALLRQLREEGEQLYQGFERIMSSMRHDERTVVDTHQSAHRPGQHSVADLTGLLDDFHRSTDSHVVLNSNRPLDDLAERLGPLRSHILFRVTQEALNNVNKHAHGADTIVDIEDDGTSLLLSVENAHAPGTRGDAARRLSLGYGLEGMRDRLTAAGGHLRTGPTRHGGWSVHALLPYPPRETAHGGRRTKRHAGPPASGASTPQISHPNRTPEEAAS